MLEWKTCSGQTRSPPLFVKRCIWNVQTISSQRCTYWKLGKLIFNPISYHSDFSLSNLNFWSSLPKVQEMLEMTNLCDGIILVGEAFSGKTTLYQVVLLLLLFYSNNTTHLASKINFCSRLWQKCLPSWGGRLTGRRTRCTGSSWTPRPWPSTRCTASLTSSTSGTTASLPPPTGSGTNYSDHFFLLQELFQHVAKGVEMVDFRRPGEFFLRNTKKLGSQVEMLKTVTRLILNGSRTWTRCLTRTGSSASCPGRS